MKRLLSVLLTATCLAAIPATAQNAAPDIAFTSSDIIKMPKDTYFGEVAGVATNSKGDIFVFQRSGNPTGSLGGARTFVYGGNQLLQFDPSGKFVREIGKGIYGNLVAQQVRVDKDDNIWTVDRYATMVIKFSPDGSRIVMMLGRKAEAISVPSVRPGAGGGQGGGGAAARAPGSGAQQDVFTGPTDVAWDAAGNIFVADGLGGNARVAKFSPAGVFIKSWGATGTGNDQFASPRSLAVDAAGNVYVADRGNKRIQVFDNDGTYKSAITGVGDPAALCLSGGATPYLYSSNSNPVNDLDAGGEIYKIALNGTVVGKFGRAGKAVKEFGTVNAIDCRTANTLLVGEVGNYRVQKLVLRP